MDTFQQLLEQDEFVRKQRALGFSLGKAEGKEEGKAEGLALGKQEGLAKGKVEGEITALRLALVEVVKGRFPFLAEMARQQVQQVHDVEALRVAIGRMAIAADESAARLLLNSLLAS